MRTKNTIMNLCAAFAGQLIAVIVNLISRIIFVEILSAEYLGLSGLFSNILSVFSLVELGIGPAMSFSLYKPLAEKDISKVKSLMRLYKNAYRTIGVVVCFIGVLCMPVYPFMIKGKPNIENIDIIYLMFVANISISYFFAYKRSLISCNQKKYIITIYHYIFYTMLNLSQIAVLLLTKSYILFLVMQILFTFLENFFLSIRAERMYPYLKEKDIEPLDNSTKSEIKKNIGAMVFHNVGGIVVGSTDNILISSFVGLVQTGLYSNYLLIISAVRTIFGQIGPSVIPGLGELGAKDDAKKLYDVFLKLFFLMAWIYSFCTVCLLTLLNPFIKIAFGDSYLFSWPIVLFLCLNFYITSMCSPIRSIREATGAYVYDKYKPLFESVVNLVVSLILVKAWGILGVFVGTFISTITTCAWVEPYVIYKHILKAPLKEYFIKYFKYTILTAFSYVTVICIADFFEINEMSSFLLRLLLCLIIPNFFWFMTFRKSHEFKYYMNLVLRLVSHSHNKE